MRTLRSPAIPVGALCLHCLVSTACGGRQAATGGIQSKDNAPVTSPPIVADAGASSTGPATTTLILGDAGELQGVKLAEIHRADSPPAAEGPAAKRAHGHDPGRSPADIRSLIVAHRDEARACYERGLANHPGIEGDLVIQFTIDSKGIVTQASLDSSRSQVAEPSIVECVSDVIKKIQFAPSQGGFESRASYPFNFHAHGPQKPKAP